MPYKQGSSKYLAPGGLTLKIFKIRGGGEVNSLNLMNNSGRSPQNFFNKFFNYNFLKILPKFYWNLIGGTKGNISELVKNISFGPPYKVFLNSSQNIFWFPLWDFFRKNFPGGLHSTYIPPWWTMLINRKLKVKNE